MPKVTVHVPEGRYCNPCQWLQKGTILCLLFDSLCEEDPTEERYSRIIKHSRCPLGEEDDYNDDGSLKSDYNIEIDDYKDDYKDDYIEDEYDSVSSEEESDNNYKVKARVLIDIETDFEYSKEDEGIPGPDTLKFCVDEDINNNHNIAGAVGDCKVVEFHVWR